MSKLPERVWVCRHPTSRWTLLTEVTHGTIGATAHTAWCSACGAIYRHDGNNGQWVRPARKPKRGKGEK